MMISYLGIGFSRRAAVDYRRDGGSCAWSHRVRLDIPSCHGPSAPWPARQNSARKKKPATPVGMTEWGKIEAKLGGRRTLRLRSGQEAAPTRANARGRSELRPYK